MHSDSHPPTRKEAGLDGLLEDGLAAWEVPEPPADLTDRILAQNAETLTALATEPEPPTHEDELPPMLPTQPRITASLRPFWVATIAGFAAAAALVLAFMAGRQSSQPAASPPPRPNVEIQVSAPVPPAQPPQPPEHPETLTPPQPPVPPPPPPRAKKRPPKPSKPAKPAPIPELKNPFATDDEPATLRLGTDTGVAPAEVYVDGEHIGRTPIVGHDVTPGPHTITFKWPHREKDVLVDLESGATNTIRANDL